MSRAVAGENAAWQAHQRCLAGLRRASRGPRVAALFDFDGTIVAGYSVFAFLREKFRRGGMSRAELAGTTEAIVRYALGELDFAGLMTAGARFAAGIPESHYREIGEAAFAEHVAGRIYPEILDLIRAHRRRGHTLAIVTAATVYQVAPAARELGIERVLCSRYALRKGRFTGEVAEPLCFGSGKLAAVQRLAQALDLDLARSYLYADSVDDLPLLEQVGRPRPVNPDRRLREVAVQRGWPTQTFASRGRPGPLDYLRGLSPYPTLAGAVAASLPIFALTGSVRETANFAVSTFGDCAAAIVGVKLAVRGERHLWSARPCVFVFNHQSNADVFIMAKLVRRDMTGVGKMELRRVPLLGWLMEMGGMVFVDRARGREAIEAMAPLVDALRRERRSVCIAPEGTRTLAGRLGPFKKGAFHLAIQAGVPIVPVVIHNSADVQPRNELTMRPATVRVEVLPPVDTSRWKPASIERHVAAVRRLFLEALGQDGEPAPPERRRTPTLTGFA